MHGDKRNPDLVRGDGETLKSYLERIGEHLSKLEWQSEGHRQWYTHKNPYGCWICQILQVGRYLESELLDIEQPISDTEGHGELEESYDYNYDEEESDLNTSESE